MTDRNTTAWLMTAKVRIEGPASYPVKAHFDSTYTPHLVALTDADGYLPTLHVTARVMADDTLLATARFAYMLQAIAGENDYVIADQDALHVGTKNIEINILGETP